jgi:glycosyltransferase involved in cell wall biosynthesis
MEQKLAGLRIVKLTTTLGTGSARILVLHAHALRRMGAEVHVWAISQGGAALDQLADEGFPTRVLGLKKHSHRFSTSRALARELAVAEPDWVHAHTYEPALHASRAKVYGAIRGLIVSHHDARLRWTRRLFNWPYRSVPDAVIAPSPTTARIYERWFGYPHDRMHILPYPLPDIFFAEPARDEDLARSLGLSGRYPVLMWVARLQRNKGHADLLRALGVVVAQYPDTLLLVVGQGKIEEELRELAAKLGLASNVRFLGTRHDVPALLPLTDVFVCPSHAETLCMAVQEALSMGRPVVSTATWGPADHIRDGETGLLVPIANGAALAQGILRLTAEPELAMRMGEAAREYARDRFTDACFEKNLLGVYLAAMRRRAAG